MKTFLATRDTNNEHLNEYVKSINAKSPAERMATYIEDFDALLVDLLNIVLSTVDEKTDLDFTLNTVLNDLDILNEIKPFSMVSYIPRFATMVIDTLAVPMDPNTFMEMLIDEEVDFDAASWNEKTISLKLIDPIEVKASAPYLKVIRVSLSHICPRKEVEVASGVDLYVEAFADSLDNKITKLVYFDSTFGEPISVTRSVDL